MPPAVDFMLIDGHTRHADATAGLRAFWQAKTDKPAQCDVRHKHFELFNKRKCNTPSFEGGMGT